MWLYYVAMYIHSYVTHLCCYTNTMISIRNGALAVPLIKLVIGITYHNELFLLCLLCPDTRAETDIRNIRISV